MFSVAKLILGIIITLGVTMGHDHFNVWYRQLCGVLSKKAVRQRLKYCSNPPRSPTELREKRDIQTTVRGTAAPTNASHLMSTTSKRTPDSYVCDFYSFPVDQNGYETHGDGLVLNVTFLKVLKDGEKLKANVSWSRPRQGNHSKCTGYSVFWYRPGPLYFNEYCDKIMNENITSYIIDSSKGWKDLPNLDVSVLPLPWRSNKISLMFHKFTPTLILTRTTTSQPSTKINANPESSPVSPQMNTRTMNNPTKNLITKRVTTLSNIAIAAIVAGIGIVSVTIVLAIRWKFRKREGPIWRKGNGPYVSYYSDNDRISTSVIQICDWLSKNNIDVTMDKYTVITYSKRSWSEHHIVLSKRVILVISPGYLKICKFDSSRKNMKNIEKEMSCKDHLAYYEICHIRHEITSKPELAVERFVVVLLETDVSELPFWMKSLNAYKYSAVAKLDESIFEVLKV